MAGSRVAGVIGRPISHSLSPVIHNAAFEAVDIDWTYEAFDVGEEEVAAFLTRAVAADFGGLSVTMPDKAVTAQVVDRLTPDAAALGAVNTVIFENGKTLGDNTDGPGFLDALADEAPDLEVPGARFAVVGAGGAARAVVLSLGRAGAAEIVVVNRTRSRAESAAGLVPLVARVGDPASLSEVDVIVNATPVGMGEETNGELSFDPELIRSGQLVCDLVYWPPETAIMQAAVERGARAVNGLGMLVHQAARAFTHWTGHGAPLDAMRSAAGAELARRR